MKGYFAALGLPLLLCVAGAAGAATTVTIDFNTPANTTPGAQVVSGVLYGAVTPTNVGGRNAVMTGGTSANEFLYVTLPKGVFKSAKQVYATVEYYDQGMGSLTSTPPVDVFQLHYDAGTDPSTLDMTTGQSEVVQHGTNMWLTHSWHLVGADFEEAGQGGADLWIDDEASGPVAIDKIVVQDTDPNAFHFVHVDKNHPVTIDGKIDPGEWDNAKSFTVNSAAQDAYKGANWSSPQDFSGTYYFEYDENGVYVRGDVTQSTPRQNDAGADGSDNYWKGDGFQIYFGLDWTDPTHTTYLPTDHDIYVGLGDGMNGSLPPSWADEWGPTPTITDWSNGGMAPIPAANLAIKDTTSPKGYQFEFFLPWAMMTADDGSNTKITPGQSIGFYFYANHSTTIGPSAQSVAMQPFGLTGQYENASHFTTVVLDPAPAQPVTTPPPAAGQ